MGRHFYNCRRQRAFGNPPLATSWPSPTPQAVGRTEVYSRSPPTSKRGWVSKHSGGRPFSQNLASPCLSGGGGPRQWWKGAAFGGLYKREGAFKHQAVPTTVYHRFLIPPSVSLRSPPTPKTRVGKGRSGRVLFSPNLPFISCREGGPRLYLYTCLPHPWGRGTMVVVEGGLLKMVNGKL